MHRMKLAATAALLLAMLAAAFAEDAGDWPLPACGPADMADRTAWQEQDAHRTFDLPTLRYAAGTRPEDFIGLAVKMRVDERGHITCMFRGDDFREAPRLTPQRSAALRELASGRYTPFLRKGKPVPVFVTERIDEEDLPAQHRPMPEVPLSEVRIEMRRTGCFGSCPSYEVAIDGSGLVTYTGDGYVDVRGPLRHRIPVEEVAALVAQARAMDFWSLRDEYRGGITDHPNTFVTFRLGGAVKQVEDYVGALDGMPRAVDELEDAIDAAARVRDFVVLSDHAVDLLVESGFRFDSREGAEMLARATENAELRDDAPLVRLVALGAPIETPPYDDGFQSGQPRPSLIEIAARRQHRALVEALLARPDGRPDAEQLQAAFVAAIEGGDLELVQFLWNHDPRRRPSLFFVSRSRFDSDSPEKRAPVTLALDARGIDTRRRWDGLAIAQWLASLGVDLRASDYEGKTLLGVAADAGDVAFVQWLIAQGLDVNAGRPIGDTLDEDVVIALLEAGADRTGVAGTARRNGWTRVSAWLAAHPLP